MTNYKQTDKLNSMIQDNKFLSYAWPGGYPVYYLDAGNNVLCPECASENDDYSEMIVDCDINYETPDLYCDHCGMIVEAAYIDD